MREKILDELVANGVDAGVICEVAWELSEYGLVDIDEVAMVIAERMGWMYQPRPGVKKGPTQELVDWVDEVLERDG